MISIEICSYIYLILSNGEGYILNLASPELIPSRFALEMKDIARQLHVPLTLVCTREKRAILIQISEATSL